jgi:uncharacterized OB-fold protein
MAITEKITNTTRPTFWEGEIPVNYVYTYGLAGEKFFRAVKDKGTFAGTRCDVCDITYVPPKIYCDRCFAKLEKYLDVGTTGYVESFTVTFKNMDGSDRERPRILAVIRIAGTDGGLIHYLEGIAIDDIALGMPVQAVFKPKSKRTGSIEDIVGFGPVRTAGRKR